MREPFGLAADAYEILDIVVPPCDILIANGPVNAHVLPQVRFEVQITPAIGLPAPYDRPTANLSSADPQEWSVGIHRVRIFFIIDEKFAVPLVHSGARLLDRLIDAYLLALAHAAKTFFPRGNMLHIIFLRCDGPSSFENQRFQTLFAEFFGRPTAGDTGAHNYGVICFR